jgi:hypothetical protein
MFQDGNTFSPNLSASAFCGLEIPDYLESAEAEGMVK